ncbi:SusC/RagA family TonB-linked outer membrane protein [Carboxylicivirga sp. N1Y90]|uniref:SusC/RagA family TonB-linked outer membrane protein n=1 Tax=Carboxylicivirga fragile TaxID=3417571 RepID=UPI003D34E3F4|nr:SusC/RagA family TonB-linked outer membrane protein [Marinilabiliaceae bacterium N1Y90]
MKFTRMCRGSNLQILSRRTLLIMKISVVFLFAVLINMSAVTLAQKVTFEQTEMTYKELFKEIEIQTGLITIYSNRQIDMDELVVLENNELELSDIYFSVLNDKGLDFEVIDEYIVVKKAAKKPIVVVQQPEEKKILIKGTVVDEKGEPLPFAAVCFKGTTSGCVSAVDGTYELEAPDEEGLVLEISSLGFVTQEIPVEGRTIINIVLIPDMMGLDEVVVTGYQTISKERATGSFSMLNSDNVANSPNETIGGNLESLVAGVQTTLDADGNTQFTIRGQSSLTADGQPLIVVDGFAIDGGLESINRNDVEKITVLKDAAAASIWGARAANGVIVITSKKGSGKKGMQVSVEAYAKFSDEVDLNYANPIASSQSQIEYEQMLWNQGWGKRIINLEDINQSFTKAGYLFEKQWEDHLANGGIGQPVYTIDTPDFQKLMNQSYQEQVKEHMLRKSFSQNYNVALRGQGERNRYSLSVMFNDNKHVIESDSDNNVLINFRNVMQVKDWLEFDFAIMEQIRNDKSSGVGLRDIQAMSPYETLLDENGNYNHVEYNRGYNSKVMNDLHSYTSGWAYDDMTYNPLQNMRTQKFETKTLSTRINAGLNFKIAEGIKYTVGFQYQNASYKTKNRYTEGSYYTRDQVNLFTLTDYQTIFDRLPYAINPETDYQLPMGEIVYLGNTNVVSYLLRNQLSIVKNYGDHAFNFIAGTETNRNDTETSREWLFGYNHKNYMSSVPDKMNNLQRAYYRNSTGNIITGGDHIYEPALTGRAGRYFSLYSNLGYTYKDKYTVSASVRTDASNLVVDEAKYRYSPFWSVGGSWQLSKEAFMESQEWLNRLTLRSTYGVNGNSNQFSSMVPTISYKSGSSPYSGAGYDYASLTDLGNSSLRWERVSQLNVALDFALFNNKLFGSVEYYDKNSEDLIAEVSVPSTDGTTLQAFNVADMENNGFELNLNANINIANTVLWKPILNYAYNNSMVNKVKEAYIPYNFLSGKSFVEGYEYLPTWAIKYNGLNEDGVATIRAKNGEVYDATVNLTNTGITATDLAWFQGTRIAPHVSSLTNEFFYKGFSLLATITGKFGHHMLVDGFSYSNRLETMNYHKNLDELIIGNEEATGEFPLPEQRIDAYGQYSTNARYLESRVADASYIRFKEVMLSYTIPHRITSQFGCSNFRVYTHINNVGMLWTANELGIDPDYPMGSSYFRPETTYTIGLSLTF